MCYLRRARYVTEAPEGMPTALVRPATDAVPAACTPAGNMMLFDKDGAIKRYDSPEAILKEFYDLRLEFYEKRRVALLQVST